MTLPKKGILIGMRIGCVGSVTLLPTFTAILWSIVVIRVGGRGASTSPHEDIAKYPCLLRFVLLSLYETGRKDTKQSWRIPKTCE